MNISRNHRMDEVRKALEMSSPLQCTKQGQLQQFNWPVRISHVQFGFEYLQGQKFHNLSGQPCCCLTALTVDKLFLMFVCIFLYYCSCCFLSFPWMPLVKVWLNLFHFPIQPLMKFPWKFCFPGRTIPSLYCLRHLFLGLLWYAYGFFPQGSSRWSSR